MEEKILDEIRQIRLILSEMLGTSDLPAKDWFSKEAIAKAAKDYQRLSIERGDWVADNDISKIIKKAPWRSGKLIIEKFGFANYFTRGKSLYFNRKALIELDKELKKKNIKLQEYADLLDDQEKFRKYVSSVKTGKKIKFTIPEELRDINSKPYSPVSEEFVKQEINKLMEEYKKFDLSTYISLYENKTYAMFQYIYVFDKYIDPKVKKYCKDWCFRFNYANDALKKIAEIKSEEGLT